MGQKKNLSTKKILGQEKIMVRKTFWSKKNVGKKKCWVQKNVGFKKDFGFENFLDLIKLWVREKNLGLKKILGPKNFGLRNIFGPKKLLVNTYYVSQLDF